MKQFIICLLWFVGVIQSLGFSLQKNKTQEDYTYYLSVCGFFRNEGLYLKEWIEYHRLIGVDHFYLYNDISKDNYQEILAPYIEEGIVELFHTNPNPKRRSHVQDQTKAYNECIKNSAGVTKWLAIIDLDEFILTKNYEKISDFLKQFDDSPDIAAVEMAWKLFGTSGFQKLPTDSLMIENLTWCAPNNYTDKVDPDHRRVKSILRPETVERMQIHQGKYTKGYLVYPNDVISKKPMENYDEIQLNHYWTRDEEFFHNVKIPRRLPTMPRNYDKNALKKLDDLNQEQDLEILKYVPRLKNIMGMNI